MIVCFYDCFFLSHYFTTFSTWSKSNSTGVSRPNIDIIDFSLPFSALISAFIFYMTRFTVLRKENSFNHSYKTFPIFVGLTIALNTFFIIYKGGKGIGLDDLSAGGSLVIASGTGLITGSAIIPFIPKMKQAVNNRFQQREEGEEGRRLRTSYVRYGTVLLALIQM